MTTKRYRIKPPLAGEFEADAEGLARYARWSDPATGRVEHLPLAILEEVEPPIPPEPEPGAYDIGGALALHIIGGANWASWIWTTADLDQGGWTSGSFPELWAALGGPNVSIRRLVASPEVELPWEHQYGSRSVTVDERDKDDPALTVRVEVSDAADGCYVAIWLTDDRARSMAAALWAAAGGER